MIKGTKKNKIQPEKFTWQMHGFYIIMIALNANRLNCPTETFKLAKLVTIKLSDNTIYKKHTGELKRLHSG